MLLSALVLSLSGQLPTDAPRADLDRSSPAGRSAEWLRQEILRVEASRPSAALFIGPAALAVVGILAVLTGLAFYELDRCGLFHNGCSIQLPPLPSSWALWIGGGGALVSGIALSAFVEHRRTPGKLRLAELERALSESSR